VGKPWKRVRFQYEEKDGETERKYEKKGFPMDAFSTT
jgi:hypothetical protein